MKPTTARDAHIIGNFAYPHDTWMNHDEALRIAKRRWKRARSKHLRKAGKSGCRVMSEVEKP